MAVSGLTEGIDFGDMIDKLKNVEMQKANRLFKWKSEWQARVDAFQTIRTQMVSLQTKLKTMNTVDKFLVKNAASSQPETATAKAGNATSKGVYNLEVKQLANYSSCSFQTNIKDKNAKLNTDAMGEFTYTYKDNKTRTINVPTGTTLQGFVNMINNDSQNPGVVAHIVPGRNGEFLFQLRGKDTGRDASLSVDSVTGISGMTLDSTPKWNAVSPGNADLASQYFLNPTGSDILNPSDTTPMSFTLTGSGGGSYAVTLNPKGTLVDLIAKINADPALTADLVYYSSDPNKYFLEIKDSSNNTYTLEQDNLPGDGIANYQTFSDPAAVLNTSDVPKDFIYSADGKKTIVTLQPGATVTDLFNAINAKTGETGVRAVAIPGSGGEFTMSLQHVTNGVGVTIGNGSLEEFSNIAKNNNWQVTPGADALIRYNNWPADPEWLEVASNTLTDLLDKDLTVNLLSTGKTTITVDIDSTAIYKNVEEFVEAVNAMRKTLNDLTKWDENKTTYAAEYAENQFDMQKGSVLTGNYGVQMIASRFKSIASGSGLGFRPREITKDANGDILTDVGDFFNSLSQIGIMTNADQGSDLYGLLEINTVEDNKLKTLTLEQAIKKDPEAVARLFAAKGEGYTTDARFGHVSHIDGITSPGLYDVKYEIASDGTVTGTINGKTMVKGEGNTYGIYNSGPPANAADGMVIEIYDLSPTTEPIKAQVGVRQGKVNELLATMDGAQGYLGKEGTLGILENNYKDIIKNIDDKISKEDERIIKWERTIRARFSRIEATIATYQKLNEQVKSQIAQLSNNKSS